MQVKRSEEDLLHVQRANQSLKADRVSVGRLTSHMLVNQCNAESVGSQEGSDPRHKPPDLLPQAT